MQPPRLTPTSYIVLGLVELAKEATPYELKQAAAGSIGDFWTLQHAQFYTEPERLEQAGLLTVERERGGRRRKRYRLTPAGTQALRKWRETPTQELNELRDPGLLKLFFGGEAESLAKAQLEAHRERLATYERMREELAATVPPGPLAVLDAGIGHEREYVRFWSRLAK